MNNVPASPDNCYQLLATSEVSMTDPAHHVKVLGKHFASKVDVDFLSQSTLVIFDEGSCNMIPRERKIEFHCHADNRSNMKDITDTIDRHVNAFFRKKNIGIDWAFSDANTSTMENSRG